MSLVEGSEWELDPGPYTSREVSGCSPVLRETSGPEQASPVPLGPAIPDDILEKILSFLPAASLIRSGCVCKRWHSIVRSRSTWRSMVPQNPWYFMYSCSEEAVHGFSFDPSLRKWYAFDFPCIERSNWFASASGGLVCFMDSENRSRILVCNPITGNWRQLAESPGGSSADYSSPAISTSKKSCAYTVVVMTCNQVREEYSHWAFTIHLYESRTKRWSTVFTEVLLGWRGGDECVICDGVLYFLVYPSGALGNPQARHCLVMFDLSSRSNQESLINTAIVVPCPLTCGRLMNLKGKLILVGGIGKQDRPGVIKGIGIWELCGRAWRKITQMPYKFFQGFGEVDDVFASSGAEDMVYIQSYGSPALLTFDVSKNLWKWSTRSPVTKRFPLQLFTGFSFEPRLDAES